jgi:2'-5' RNA ligase
MNAPAESALVIPIPEAEALVRSFRVKYDPSALLGLPAHVTVLYPFKRPAEITPEVVESLGELLSGEASFNAQFTEFRRFPDVLYLSPEPVKSFRHLTEIVAERFPETPPYGGRFAEIIPHLSVAHASDPNLLSEIASDFERASRVHLPIRALVKEILLMDNLNQNWQTRHRFVLKPGTGSQPSA